MIPESLSALASLASIGEKLASSSDAVERQRLLLEFLKGQNHAQQIIAGLLAEKAALTAERDALEKQLLQAEDWNAERAEYELLEIARGVFAQVRKGDKSPGASMMKFCATCFEKRQKSVLQQSKAAALRDIVLTCNSCRAQLVFHTYADAPSH